SGGDQRRRAWRSGGGDRPTGGGDQHEPAALSRKPRALRDLPAAAGPGRGSRRRFADRPRRIAPVSWVGSKPRIACVASGSAAARAAQADLAARYDLVDPGECDIIVALGGDGLLLHTIHEHLQLGRPIFGMNTGTVGFLMNQYRPDGLIERVGAATAITVHPLRMVATYADGRQAHALAFNEVAVTRFSAHSANLRLSIDGVERMAMFMGDGLIIATAAGSTAYN